MTEVTLEQLKTEYEAFRSAHGRFPTRHDLNSSESLSANVKAIERKWGGLKNLRKLLNIPSLGLSAPKDPYKKYEDDFKIQELLINTFSKSSITLGSLIKVDYENTNFLVDPITSSNRQSFIVSLNSKIKKYQNETSKIYIVDMSNTPNLETILKNRKNPTPTHITIVSLDKFTEILAQYKPNMLQ